MELYMYVHINTCDISNSGLPAQLIHVCKMYIVIQHFFTGMYPLGPSVECCILSTVYITCSLPCKGQFFNTVSLIY